MSDAPIELAFHPRWPRNPYQEMLYGRCAYAGIAVRGLKQLDELGPPDQTARASFIHLHWTDPVLASARRKVDAEAAVAEFTNALENAISRGWSLIWTQHNVIPHDCRYPDLEARVCTAIASRAVAIHLMCARGAEIAARYYEIPPQRTAVIPHSSYIGVHPDHLTAEEARARLGLEPDHTVVTAFGGIRRYKGTTVLLDAFEAAASSDPSLRLVIAGKPMHLGDLDAFDARCESSPAIVARLERIPADQIQIYLKAADALVLAHTSALNSGLPGLAYAFARPVIAPDTGCIAGQVPLGCGVTYAAGDAGALAATLAGAGELRDRRFRESALAQARAYPPEAMARDFAALVGQLAVDRASESP